MKAGPDPAPRPRAAPRHKRASGDQQSPEALAHELRLRHPDDAFVEFRNVSRSHRAERERL
jgi:hypothetical protein